MKRWSQSLVARLVENVLVTRLDAYKLTAKYSLFISLLLYCITKPFVILDKLSKIACETLAHQFSLFLYLQIDLMMSDKHPVRAMCDIRDLGLFYVVFSFPEKSNPPVFDKCDWYVLVLTSHILHFLDSDNCLSLNYISRFCGCTIMEVLTPSCTFYLCPLSSLL